MIFGVLAILGSFLLIPSQRARLVSSAEGTLSQKDLGYFSNAL
tara:strand:- start:58 stop:186 length:129 start_codon:yes stop_codon:yes gene_type:complete